MQLDSEQLLALVRQGALESGYDLDEDAQAMLRARTHRAISELGGEGSAVDNSVGEELQRQFSNLGLQLAGEAALQLQEGVRYYSEPPPITSTDVNNLFEKLCPGFWPFC
jgi:hypothetical protein